jgi:hypothetical protein
MSNIWMIDMTSLGSPRTTLPVWQVSFYDMMSITKFGLRTSYMGILKSTFKDTVMLGRQKVQRANRLLDQTSMSSH